MLSHFLWLWPALNPDFLPSDRVGRQLQREAGLGALRHGGSPICGRGAPCPRWEAPALVGHLREPVHAPSRLLPPGPFQPPPSQASLHGRVQPHPQDSISFAEWAQSRDCLATKPGAGCLARLWGEHELPGRLACPATL